MSLKPLPPSDQPSGDRIRRLALSLFAILSLVSLAVALPVLMAHDRGVQTQSLNNEAMRIHRATEIMGQQLVERTSNLKTLSKAPVLARFLSHRDEPSRQGVVQIFQSVVSTYRSYDQVRIIDLHGHEVLKVSDVDGKPQLASERELQDKSARYYVQAALKLGDEELYLSRLDLNVENGVLEQPIKPVIRMLTPLQDLQGRRAGLLVFNVRASALLRDFRANAQLNGDRQRMLLNPRGHWLSHPDPSQEWGADRGHPDLRFDTLYPDAWPKVRMGRSGQVHVQGASLVFDTVDTTVALPSATPKWDALTDTPNTALPPNWLRVVSADPYWKIVTVMPDAALDSQTLLRHPLVWLLGLLVLSAYAFGAYLYACLVEERRAARLHDQQLQHQLSDLYEQAPCGYHSLDPQGRVTRMNQTELSWLGCQLQDVVGQPMLRWLSPASQAVFNERFPQFMASGKLESLELELVGRHGITLPVSVSATVIRNEQGQIEGTRSVLFDISERLKYEALLKEQAHSDALTGIANRRHLLTAGAVEVARANRQGLPLAVLMIDADHFKHINDQHGHEGGDIALRVLGRLMREMGRLSDLPARIGGEEFAMLLPGTDREGALMLAERLRRQVASACIEAPSGERIRCTVSVGVAVWQPGSPIETIEVLLSAADGALYKAKAAGRNRVEIAPSNSLVL